MNQRPGKGINRINWDLRYASYSPIMLNGNKFTPVAQGGGRSRFRGGSGTPVMPGKYSVSLDLIFNGKTTPLVEPVMFNTVSLNNTTLSGDPTALMAFQNEIAKLSNVASGTESMTDELMTRVQYVKQAVNNTPGIPYELMAKASALEKELDDILWKFNGQRPKASQEENWPAPPSINEYLSVATYGTFRSTSGPTQTMREQMQLAKEALKPVYDRIKVILEVDIVKLEAELDKYGVPFTPGRLPAWGK